jgi:hypothetical protein
MRRKAGPAPGRRRSAERVAERSCSTRVNGTAMAPAHGAAPPGAVPSRAKRRLAAWCPFTWRPFTSRPLCVHAAVAQLDSAQSPVPARPRVQRAPWTCVAACQSRAASAPRTTGARPRRRASSDNTALASPPTPGSASERRAAPVPPRFGTSSFTSTLASPRRGTLAPNTCILRCSGPATFSFAARPLAVRRAGSEHTRHCEPKRYAHQTAQRAASPASAVPVGRGTCSRAAAAQFDVFTSWSDPPRLSFTSGQPFIRPATVIPHWPPSCTPTQAYESDPEPHPEAA